MPPASQPASQRASPAVGEQSFGHRKSRKARLRLLQLPAGKGRWRACQRSAECRVQSAGSSPPPLPSHKPQVPLRPSLSKQSPDPGRAVQRARQPGGRPLSNELPGLRYCELTCVRCCTALSCASGCEAACAVSAGRGLMCVSCQWGGEAR